MTSRMQREIGEQPEALTRTLDALLPLRSELRQLATGRRQLLFVARGTSDNAGVYGRYLVEIHAGLGVALAAPSLTTHYAVRRDLSDTVVVSLSQSGATEEIIETQAWARACGASTIAVTNEAVSPLAAQADLALVTQAGPELAVPATKTYTTQLAAIAVLADALGPPNDYLATALRRVPDELARLIVTRPGIDDALAALADRSRWLVSGRGLVYGSALELALKLEETCRQPVRALSYADLRHGPIAVVDRATSVVLLSAQDGPLVSGMTELALEVAQLGAQTVGIGGDDRFAAACEVAVAGPDLPELVAPLGLAIPAQLLAEGLARERGLDPDAPRGLSKVTQTDARG
jgi:glutamine---fructose-6-phosphate transaminase (isomerizing)